MLRAYGALMENGHPASSPTRLRASNIDQNAAMKLFSGAALILLPATLIAGIYGMNLRMIFPELGWTYAYRAAIALMLASAILPPC